MKAIARFCVLAAVALVGIGVGDSWAAKQFLKPSAVRAKSAPVFRIPGIATEVVPIELNRGDLMSLRHGEEIELALPNGTSRSVVFELAQSHGGGIDSWVGYIKERGRDNRVIVTMGPNGAYGVLDTPEGTYRIVPSMGSTWLVDMTAEQRHLPEGEAVDDGLIPPQNVDKASKPGVPSFSAVAPGVNYIAIGKTTPAPQAVIDLYFVVTQTLAQKLGGNLMTRLYFLITRANTTYADSEVAMTVRLVGLSIVNYTDTNVNGTALNEITPLGSGGTGVFSGIEAARIAAGADLVSFMRDGGSFSGSGVAWVGSTNPSASPGFMYSVTTGCTAGCESVWIHEVGHNMGNKHDRYTDGFQYGPPGSGTYFGGAFPYGYGYAFCKSGALTCDPDPVGHTQGTCTTGAQPECSTSDASNFRDIMAYFQGTATQLYKFSNPALTCATPGGDGVARPCGVNEAAATSANTALAMNNNRVAVSAVKSPVAAAQMPGSIQFTSTTFGGNEGGTATFTVSRMRDSTIVGGGGTASVQYALTAGSATAGTDYVVTSGTLNWADGDFANKTFTVTLSSDALTEGNETFTATLSNVVGSPGIFLGYPSSVLGIVQEPWPPGGTAPTGFSSASTPALPWAVASDSFDPAGGDSVSFKSAAIADSATGNSSTVYTATFAAGTLAFRYRVSSFPSNGFFEFLVDGTVILQDSGDTGQWVTYTTSLTAGSHTLEWRYRKTLSFACRFAIPVTTPPTTAPPYPNCADRAWIDSLTFPSAPPNPPRLANISTRMQVLTGNDVMIAGFIIGGSTPKTVVVRARGPSLIPAGITNALANPLLQLFSGPTQIAANDNWQAAANAAAITASGFAPDNTLESAILVTLNPGAYTAIVSGVGNTTGVGIVEVFEVDAVTVPLINISTRGQVLTGNDVMIAGIIIQGNGPQTVVVRARGPSLIPAGITNALANPQLALFSGQTQIGYNDNWQSAANAAQIISSGFQPDNTLEAAILITLNPGAYTAIVSGVGNVTGVAIVEVFTTP